MRATLCAIALPLALLAAPASHAARSYDNCIGTVSTLPAVITTQGTWCLKADVSTGITSGAAITINANNVTLDCNDFKVGGLSAGTDTQAVGISSTGRLNLTVRNCNVRGFAYGVLIDGGASSGHVIEDSRFEANTRYGIRINGDNSEVRRNLVIDTGGTTIPELAGAIGIYALRSVDIRDNTITGVTAPDTSGSSSALGIVLEETYGSSVHGNRIRGLVPSTGGEYGIFLLDSHRASVRGNTIVGTGGVGTTLSVGVYCGSADSTIRDNDVQQMDFVGDNCVDGGGNILD